MKKKGTAGWPGRSSDVPARFSGANQNVSGAIKKEPEDWIRPGMKEDVIAYPDKCRDKYSLRGTTRTGESGVVAAEYGLQGCR